MNEIYLATAVFIKTILLSAKEITTLELRRTEFCIIGQFIAIKTSLGIDYGGKNLSIV